jgi:hypothetical protein
MEYFLSVGGGGGGLTPSGRIAKLGIKYEKGKKKGGNSKVYKYINGKIIGTI